MTDTKPTSLRLWPEAQRLLPALIEQAGSQSAAINQAIIDSWWLRYGVDSEAVREAADKLTSKGRNDPAESDSEMHIKIEYDNSEDAMYGPEGADGYDAAASEAEFERALEKALRQHYPAAEIEITTGYGRYSVDGDTASDEAERVGLIVHEVWSEFDWLVEAE